MAFGQCQLFYYVPSFLWVLLTIFSSILFESIELMIIYEGYLFILQIYQINPKKLKKTIYYF